MTGAGLAVGVNRATHVGRIGRRNSVGIEYLAPMRRKPSPERSGGRRGFCPKRALRGVLSGAKRRGESENHEDDSDPADNG
jgi:hypothetical protein